jgi:hypothetical protein
VQPPCQPAGMIGMGLRNKAAHGHVRLEMAFDHHLLDFGNRLARRKSFRAHI